MVTVENRVVVGPVSISLRRITIQQGETADFSGSVSTEALAWPDGSLHVLEDGTIAVEGVGYKGVANRATVTNPILGLRWLRVASTFYKAANTAS